MRVGHKTAIALGAAALAAATLPRLLGGDDSSPSDAQPAATEIIKAPDIENRFDGLDQISFSGERYPVSLIPEEIVNKEASESAPTAPAPDVVAERLREVTQTFLTDRPDVQSLYNLAVDLANSASVQPESVHTEQYGEIEGDLAIDGSSVRARFKYEPDGDCSIVLSDRLGESVPPYTDCKTKISFHVDQSPQGAQVTRARIGVQFYPLDAKLASELNPLNPGGDRVVGWLARFNPDDGSTLMMPTLSSPSDRTTSWSPYQEHTCWDTDDSPQQHLYQLLEPHIKSDGSEALEK